MHDASRIALALSVFDVPFGWFDVPASLNRLLGVQWLARLLHPTLFPEPPAPVVKAFHTR